MHAPTAESPLTSRADSWLERERASGRLYRRAAVVIAVFLATMLVVSAHAADFVWRQLGLRDGHVVALNSSGAFGAAKLWPIEHSAQLTRRIVDELGFDVLILCGPSERDAAGRIVQLAGRPGENAETWRQAGVKSFIYMGCDALATLRAAHDILNVT